MELFLWDQQPFNISSFLYGSLSNSLKVIIYEFRQLTYQNMNFSDECITKEHFCQESVQGYHVGVRDFGGVSQLA